ncbi:MAG TPA: glycosyltransferase family 2 protein [Methanocella sp.]|nr:glycosyltransferase family 2 protein [Methanocella sp.]
MKKLISIAIPAYNEEGNLDELKKRLQEVMSANPGYDFEVIISENGSWDRSYEILLQINREDPRFKVVQLSRNFGCDGGITAAMHHAKGDALVIMMADLQEPPEMISEFIKKWEEGYDVVYGKIMKRAESGFMRVLFTKMFYRIMYLLTNKAFPEDVSDFRLMDRRVYLAVNSMEERNRLLRGLIAWTGFRQYGIPFDRRPRYAGKSTFNYIAVFKLAFNGIFAFSYFPLKLATVFGTIISLLAFIAAIIEVAMNLIFGREVPGFTTLITVILLMSGIIILILGIIGEYISRIYDEVKQRPNYIIRNEIGFQK